MPTMLDTQGSYVWAKPAVNFRAGSAVQPAGMAQARVASARTQRYYAHRSSAMSRAVRDPAQPEEVSAALLEYVGRRASVAGLHFAEPPEQIVHGEDTYIYTFRLEAEGLDPAWARPLVLRIYATAGQGDKAEREAAVQRFAADRGYPTPRPLAVEVAHGPFDLPFMVMERAPGVTMLHKLEANPLGAFRLVSMMANAHAALHNLPVDGCPLPSDAPLVERRFAEFRDFIDRYHLPGLDEAFGWLESHKGTVIPEELSLCHNDFHPLNLIVDDGRGAMAIDWTRATLGDRHHDIARTRGILSWAPLGEVPFLQRMLVTISRGLLVRRYLQRYQRLLPINRERLKYWEALQAFQAWVEALMLQRASPEELGARPDRPQRLPPDFTDKMRRVFWKLTRG
jgi:aminoglycoside phosphotransferase (APT) family kinase protein